jgi:two-component system chemotaxis response regulator CheB
MRKVIVLGGSAGAIKAFCRILEGLPRDLEAPLLAVIHIGHGPNQLASVLDRCSRIPVQSLVRPTKIQPGCVYLAGPDRHMVVTDSRVTPVMGPRENRQRPAINALFRSAARNYRDHVIAVVLSGSLDDGTAGAAAVKARGGTVLVQKPEDAEIADMPASVMRNVQADYCIPCAEMPALLTKLSLQGPVLKASRAAPRQLKKAAEREANFLFREPPALTCPDCGGTLTDMKVGRGLEFRCHVGHAFSLASLSEAHSDALERALWSAVRRLNEQRRIEGLLAQKADQKLRPRHCENIASAERDMELLHDIIRGL